MTSDDHDHGDVRYLAAKRSVDDRCVNRRVRYALVDALDVDDVAVLTQRPRLEPHVCLVAVTMHLSLGWCRIRNRQVVLRDEIPGDGQFVHDHS